MREDRANRWVIVAFGLIGVLAAYLPAYTDRKGLLILDGDAIGLVSFSSLPVVHYGSGRYLCLVAAWAELQMAGSRVLLAANLLTNRELACQCYPGGHCGRRS